MKATRTCSIEGCDRTAERRGWCRGHYRRWLRHSDPTAGRLPNGLSCAVVDCERPNHAGGYCNMHRLRMLNYGDPLHVEARPVYQPLCGEANPRWTGSDASYVAIHRRLSQHHGPANGYQCRHCDKRAAEWAYDHSDPAPQQEEKSGPYSLNLLRYMPLCVPCHRRFDAAMTKRGESNEVGQ